MSTTGNPFGAAQAMAAFNQRNASNPFGMSNTRQGLTKEQANQQSAQTFSAAVQAANPHLDFSKRNLNNLTGMVDPYQQAEEYYRRYGTGMPQTPGGSVGFDPVTGHIRFDSPVGAPIAPQQIGDGGRSTEKPSVFPGTESKGVNTAASQLAAMSRPQTTTGSPFGETNTRESLYQQPMQQSQTAAFPGLLLQSSQQSPYSNISGSPQLQSAINSRYGGNQNVIPLEGRFGLVRLAKGGDVSKSRQLLDRFAYGGLVSPQAEWFLSSEDADTQKRMQDQAKTYEDEAAAYNAAQQKYKTEVYDPYISQIEAYNKAVEAFNAGPRTSPFGMSVPTEPEPFSMTAPTLPFTEEQAKQTTADIQKRADEQYLGRAAGLEVMLDPKKYNLGIRSIFDSPTRRFNQGGEATTDDFIKSNVPRGTSEVPEVDSKGDLIDEREEIRSESQRMLNRLQSQPSKLPPGIRRTVAATKEQGKESMFPVAAPARDLLSGIIGASPTAPGSEAYRTGQAIANMPPVQAAAAIPAKIAASAGDAATALAAMGPAVGAVVKRKGGNWLANAISDEMQNLKLDRFGNDPVDIYEGMRSVYTPEAMSRLSPETLQQVKEGFAALKPQVAINKWIDTKLAKYMQNEFATPEDPVRALIERGISPARNPGDINPIYDYNNVFEKRKKAGFPVEGLAETEAGRNWEEMADSSVNVSSLKDLLSSLKDRQESKYGMIRNEANRTLRDNPWLNKLTLPDTPIYGALGANYRPVLNHVIDELQNAMATNSGLPKNLQLDPDDLSKMNVPQVVELVDKINKWRVDNIKNLQLEETLKADLYKAYPEQKYRWVQLNRPGQFAAESDAMGHSVRGYEPPDKGGSEYYGLGGFKAIQSGEAKVYSLRDEKGQPHVTIEVSAAPGAMNPSEFYYSDLATQSLFDRLDKVDEATINRDKSSWWEEVVRESPEYQEYLKTIPPKVTQIKGKGNGAPAEKYLPFIQDFVKSGNWSEIDDLQNTGLIVVKREQNLPGSTIKINPGYYTLDELRQLAVDNNMSQDMLNEWMRRLNAQFRSGAYKDGGEVIVPRETSTSKKQLDTLAQISQRKKA